MITFKIASSDVVSEETLVLWITNTQFIDDAIAIAGNPTPGQLPVFNKVIEGTDCDPNYTWHVDPEGAAFADAAIEVCDGRFSYVEEHLAEWIATVGNYCPWSAYVDSVNDLR